ncbi:hypothetical protein [Streptomyces sp. NPDC058297]|uniref:hypothetical protein n=1 Tax=Streptomyces sp. NPDC058297 TaxID=3346433 RepID=UPI0036F06924
MAQGRRLDSLRFLLRNRDSKYTRSFDAVFEADNVEILLSPPQAPRANAICERVVGTLRREVLDQMLIYNEATPKQRSPTTSSTTTSTAPTNPGRGYHRPATSHPTRPPSQTSRRTGSSNDQSSAT